MTGARCERVPQPPPVPRAAGQRGGGGAAGLRGAGRRAAAGVAGPGRRGAEAARRAALRCRPFGGRSGLGCIAGFSVDRDVRLESFFFPSP